ncbi:RES family NAD+ phosphorylase [Bacillus cereus]|uniref:RES family NAD+ phosphorylase n=1 Tax=Bacillus cereus TaxID=1396 RepID=UPI0018794D20|nr:RES family NAD+ phosphorylase [Bacillus cereus]MBE7123673.1 RES domain-containing protein [Bacillus cereus]
MYCCEKCFKDVNVINFIKEEGKKGACNYCNSQDVFVISSDKLASMFNILSSYYKPTSPGEDFDPEYQNADDVGVSLWTLVQKDWGVFSLSTKHQLLYDIVNSERTINNNITETTLFSSAHDSLTCSWTSEMWHSLSNNLINHNRYFPEKNLDYYFNEGSLLDYLATILKNTVTTISTSTKLYRARIGYFDSTDALYAPPESKILRSGRANPIGIRVLYSAINVDTAIAEVRPWKSSKITIASVTPTSELHLVDLTNIKSKIENILKSPFNFKQNIYKELDALYFLSSLDEVLSKPIDPNISELEYIPSQYLTEFIKSLGYDGVIYSSSLGTGENYAFFETYKFNFDPSKPSKPSKLEIKIIDYYKINDIMYDYSSVHSSIKQLN